MLRKVLKRIPKGRGEYLESGTILDVSSFRNVKMLESGRYLGEVSAEEAKAYADAQKPAPAPKPAVKPAPKAKSVKSVSEDTPVVGEDDK
ncbi:hypothetical protein UFOVP711_6 [uncultured Caudovirales phage]|jgi:hypothetical protein|uniref:Uncharacterized protein n=1 Tax=uncultured Caudovirales phage TaxID=2100421 RepID=A0A6J5NTE3_9CAUD|nr:hypothetical protein UFOVP711_6 [uncultured Caudovirales phage]